MPDDCTIVIDDKITICSYAFSGTLLKKISGGGSEFIDLSENLSVEEFREKIRNWRAKPLLACGYCNGCDPVNSPRIKAAKQIGE